MDQKSDLKIYKPGEQFEDARNSVRLMYAQQVHLDGIYARLQKVKSDMAEQFISRSNWHSFIEKYLDKSSLLLVKDTFESTGWIYDTHDPFGIKFQFSNIGNDINKSFIVMYIDLTTSINDAIKRSKPIGCGERSFPLCTTLVTKPIPVNNLSDFIYNGEIKETSDEGRGYCEIFN